ncbi:hypothetical protein ACQ4LE_003380 [Meloidogyne hapla]
MYLSVGRLPFFWRLDVLTFSEGSGVLNVFSLASIQIFTVVKKSSDTGFERKKKVGFGAARPEVFYFSV